MTRQAGRLAERSLDPGWRLPLRRLRRALQVKAQECNEKVVYTSAGCATPTLAFEAACYETNLVSCELEVGPWNGEWSG